MQQPTKKETQHTPDPEHQSKVKLGPVPPLSELDLMKARFGVPIDPEDLDRLTKERKTHINKLARSNKSLGSALRDIGNFTDKETGYTLQFAMCYHAYIAASTGDKDARSWISDRTEGKAVQRKIIQNLDVISKVMEILERVISDPLPTEADALKRMLAFEFEKLASAGDASYDI